MPSVLIIDDEPNIRRMVGALLQSEGYDVREAASGASGVQAIAEDEPDVALLDLMMPGELDGIATLNRIRERWTDLPVIMMSGRASLSDAVKATKLGAVNFLEKPLSPETVLLALSTALELRQSRRVTRALREDLGLTGVMVGSSAAMQQISDIIARVAPTDSRVLINGESGTGKELVAAAIHEQSPRRDKPFVRVNCAAIPKDLVESEMFGHEKGSFTGATNTRVGRFELAHTGTLFLDEIGDLSIEAQAKLLRAIEAKEIQRVGGNKTIRVDVRVIAATNKDLARAVAEGTFREDLYFRLNVIPIQLPPLRERGDDVLELVRHFSALQYRRTSHPRLEWSDDALALMRAYPWPGNIRELANIVERIAILNRGSQVRASDVMAVLPSPNATDLNATHSLESSRGLNDILEEKERSLITDALARANGSVAEAARQLQTDRPNLYRRMKRLGITGSMIFMLLTPMKGDAQEQEERLARHTSVSQTIENDTPTSSGTLTHTTPARDTIPRDTAVTQDTVTKNPTHNPIADLPDTLIRVEPLLSLKHRHSAHHFGFGLTSGKVYNRVEGLPVHFGPTYSFTTSSLLLRARAYGIARTARAFRVDAPDGGYDAHIDAYFGPSLRFGIGARFYSLVAPVERWQMAEPENGLATFLLHRDYLDYYTRHGTRGTLSWDINRKATVIAGYAEERWNSITERDAFSVFRSGQQWRPNPSMDEGKFRLVTLDAVLDTRNDERSPSGGWWITGGYEYGNSPAATRAVLPLPQSPSRIEYGRLFVDIRRYNRISPRTQINGRFVFGGWLHGDELPLQRKVSIGGPGTLPGYDFRKTVNDDVFVCGGGSTPSAGMPALCDRVFLGQLEVRTELASAPFRFVNNPMLRIRSAGFTLNPQAVFFADVGRAWRTTVDWSNAVKADVGVGIDLGLIGVYVAKAVTDWSEAANLIVRARRRF